MTVESSVLHEISLSAQLRKHQGPGHEKNGRAGGWGGVLETEFKQDPVVVNTQQL